MTIWEVTGLNSHFINSRKNEYNAWVQWFLGSLRGRGTSVSYDWSMGQVSISRITVHPNHPRNLCSAGLYPFPLNILVSEVGNITEDKIAARIQKGLHYVTGLITVKPAKPWTPEIFLESYCVAIKKPIRREKTKPQARTLIGHFHDDDVWLQLPEFISSLLSYLNFSIPLRFKEQ